MKSSERLLRSSHRVTGSFASDNQSPIAREVGRSPMLQYQMRSAHVVERFSDEEAVDGGRVVDAVGEL